MTQTHDGMGCTMAGVCLQIRNQLATCCLMKATVNDLLPVSSNQLFVLLINDISALLSNQLS